MNTQTCKIKKPSASNDTWGLNLSVKNCTGAVITNVNCTHECNGQAKCAQIPSMNPNDQLPNPPLPVITYSWHKDYYKVMFILNGQVKAGDCYCSADSGARNVMIQLYADHWNVQYDDAPSDSCLNKSYND